MKIVADKAIPFIQYFFSSLGELQLVDGREIDTAVVKDADVLIVRTVTGVNEQLLNDSQIGFVGSATSGIDHVDTDYLQDRAINFAHAPGCNARSVAEYVLSSLFVLADQGGFNLENKQIGIIGYGHVGKQLDGLLQACGIKTLVNDPILQAETGDRQFCQLDEVLQSDVVTLHVPLSNEGPFPTHHMINNNSLGYLKEDVILINTSRGGVVDENALLRFKNRNNDARLVVDVWNREPDINTELLMLTTINTPHIAGYSTDAKLSGTRMVCNAFHTTQSDKLPLLPQTELSEITLDSFGSDIEALQMAVLSAYDVRGDSVSLRRIFGISQEKRAAFFHELRNNYPVRREFPAIRVKLTNETETLESKLSALGFKVTH